MASPLNALSRAAGSPDGRISPWPQRTWWLLIAALLIAGVAVGSRPRRGADFRVFLTAAERFVEGTDLYRIEDGKMPFKYAPATAALFVPFTPLNRRVAAAAWNALSILALVAVVRSLARSPALRLDTAEWPWARVVATVVLFPALAFEVFYSQVDLLLLALVVAAAVGAERGRAWAPGVAIAAAVLLKPPAAVVGLYFLLRRHWRVIGAAAVVGAAAMLLVAARYGIAGAVSQTQAWADTLARTTGPWALNPNAQGLPTLLTAVAVGVGGAPSSGTMVASQVLSICLFVALVVWARPAPPQLLAAVCLGVALLSPQGWRANFVVAWPLALTAAQSRQKAPLIALAAVLLVGVVVSGVSITPATAAMLAPRPFAIAYSALLLAVLAGSRRAHTASAANAAEVRP